MYILDHTARSPDAPPREPHLTACELPAARGECFGNLEVASMILLLEASTEMVVHPLSHPDPSHQSSLRSAPLLTCQGGTCQH